MIKICIIMLVLTGTIYCATIDEGIVVEKWFEAETYHQAFRVDIDQFKDHADKKKVSYLIKDGEDYCIMLNGSNKKGKEILKVFYLKQECWDSIQVGQYFIVSDKCYDYDFTYEIIGDLNVVPKKK